MHPDKWTVPALEEFMGGSITPMAAGYTPAPVEPDDDPTPRNKKTNRPPQHKHLTKSSQRPKKYPPGHESNQRWGDDCDDDNNWQPDEPDQPPVFSVSACNTLVTPVTLRCLKGQTGVSGQNVAKIRNFIIKPLIWLQGCQNEIENTANHLISLCGQQRLRPRPSPSASCA